ncbi:dystrophin-like [Zerene cesonia]|uniref:dystrophin-like n=1 Tax=Zerene cesonia TaxID=33412 RepID=UPI0018E50799|nr:dystrophin-like [Zerene cesonia]
MAIPSPLGQRKLTWIVEIGEVPPYRSGPYEKHLNYSKNEREDVQKKTFAKWINSQLAKHGKPLVEDLFQDLRDGEVLLSLLEILTDQQFKRERGRMRVHHLNNVNAALRALAAAGVRLVNISSGDIVDGNPKLVLGLVWSIILHWQVHYHLKELMSELQQTNLEKTLLAWCRTHTQNYSGVDVTNFSSSWADGLAFNALLHRWRPQLFEWAALAARPPAARLEHAFRLAHTHLRIDRLLDPEDVNTPNPDKKSIMMYVMCLFQSLGHGEGAADGEVADLHSQKFLLELSEQQCRVGAVLEEGARLIRDAALTKEEANEVRLQMRLLNERWEELRVAAMRRQAAGHSELMRAQHDHLHAFRQWLTATEDRMSRMEAARAAPRDALRDARALHADLRTQQPLVDALADCVVVVDDDHDAGVTEIEDQLRALGERWSHACQWTLARLQRLQALCALLDHSDTLHTAADELERDLKQMEANPVSEIGEVLARISALQRCKHSAGVQRAALGELLQRLEALQPADAALGERAEALHDRLDATEMILRVQVDRIKELGFELDMSSTESSPTPTYGDARSVTTTVTVSHAAGPAAGPAASHSKKPRLDRPADFQHGYGVFETWADETERALQECAEQLACGGGAGRAARAAVRGAVQRVQQQSERRRADLARLEGARAPHAHHAVPEEAQQHADSIENLKRRWEGIQRSLLEIRNTMNLLEDKENFDENLAAIQRDIDDIHAWKDKMLKEKPSNNQLIHLRNKIRLMKQIETKLKELNAQSIILLTKAIPTCHKDDIEADTKRINKAFEELFTYLSGREVEIKLAINKKPVDKHEDEYKMVQKKVQDMENQIIAEHAVISSKEHMEKTLEELKRLKKDFEEIQSTYDSVVKDRKQNYERGSVEELNFRSSVENLVTRFTDSQAILGQKIQKLENGIELLDNLHKETSELSSWLQQVSSFVESHSDIPLGDAEALESLLIESNNFDESKANYKAKLDKIESIKNTILEDCDETLSKHLKSDTKELQKRFNDVTNASFKLNENLRRSLERIENVIRRIDEMEKWLEEIENEIPKEEECEIRDSGELYQMKTRFQALKDKCDEKTTEFRNLNEAGHDILVAAEGATRLARRLTQLSAGWTRATHCIYERYKVLAEAWHESGELRAWLAQHTAWLDGLARRLRSSPARADAEEISDELYDLENYLANQSTERVERIESIGRALIDAHIMPAWIRAELDRAAQRGRALAAQAAARTRELEAAAQEAAKSELSLDNLHQWLLRLRTQPPPPDQVEAEFGAAHALVREVQAQVAAYRAAGKPHAADRLRDQLQLAQAQLLEAERQRGPAPADPAERLRRAELALAGVQRDAAELQLRAAEPDAVRALLRRCLKFYRTLSEIKSEVESIIKTGRKMVEEKSVPEPQEFSKKIDTLKELYNKLGAHITESKTRLETALLTAREIQNDLQSLTSWLQGLGNVGKQTLELEMSRMEAIKDKLNANYVEFTKICDPVHLESLRKQIDDINERWEHLKRHGLKKETEVETLQRYLNDIDQELESPETLSAAKLNLLKTEVRAKASEVEAMDNKALSKQWSRIVEKITAKESNVDAVVVSYENITDTIKRRLESPVNTPDTERPELKKSKIPLALKSPVPIKKEIKEGGNRSRGSSLERRQKKADSPMSESVTSNMSIDSIEGSISVMSSLPSTPGTPKKDSSTFNLLKDSDLFTQISNNKIEPKHTVEVDKPKEDPCQVVEVKEHEIMKSSVSSIEPMEIYPSDTVESVVEFIPQNVETVEIIDDTEGESMGESDDEKDSKEERNGKRSSVDFGSEPKTFVIEVKKFEERMKPTLGILKHRSGSEEKKKSVTVNDVPDLIPTLDVEDNDVSLKTPPPTPMDESEALECPLLYDLALRQKEVQKNLLRDEVNEYLILDEVPKDQAALPEPSATEVLASETIDIIRDDIPVKKVGVGISGSTLERLRRKSGSGGTEEEVIYSEVEDMPKVRLSASDFDERKPTATSTPIKDSKQQVQVVAMSPKPSPESDALEEDKSVSAGSVPANRSHIPVSTDRKSDKYNKMDDYAQVCEEGEGGEGEGEGAGGDAELAQFEGEAQRMSRRLHVMLLTLGGVASERDPAKRLEILKNQLGAIAPDAAALISRGDSLVYARHKEDPQLAEYIQTHFQDKLRNKWSLVMSEIELKRNAAIQAEDQIVELGALAERLRSRARELERAARAARPGAPGAPAARAGEGADAPEGEGEGEGEAEAERAQELVRELRAQRVAFPERAAADALAAYARARDALDAALADKDKKGKEAEGAEAVRRAGAARAALAAAGAALRAPPLAGPDFADFPLQEDALAKIKAQMGEAEALVEEAEAARRRCGGERARRGAERLRRDWAALQAAFRERHERWTRCQETWASLYAALESGGEELDALERELDAGPDPQRLADLEQRAAAAAAQAARTQAAGRGVVRACAGALARDVLDQLHALGDRAHLLQRRLRSAPAGAAHAGAAHEAQFAQALERAAELLQTTAANPADSTSLAVRLSLVRARQEELSASVARAAALPPRARPAPLARLALRLAEAQTQLSQHGEYVERRLAALASFSARLDAALAALAAGQKSEELDEEVRSLLEEYESMERECGAARHSVAPDVRERVLRLRDLRGAAPPAGGAAAGCSLNAAYLGFDLDLDTATYTSARVGSRRRSSQGSPAALLANFDTSVLQIRDWVSVEVDMLRAQPVAVGDVEDILQQLDKQKGVLRELEQKKPQLDELLHTAESLKGTENRQQLHGKGT